MTTNMLIAGFGGQGILFTGKFLAYEGLLEGREVSWLPSYGPEMRGGTANCSVILSDTPVGSPIVANPDTLLVMNLPSLDKYEDATVKGGKIFVDSALIGRKVNREDVEAYYIPATKLASDEGLTGLANMILLGFVIKHTNVIPFENIERALTKVVPASKQHLIESNRKALELGYNYEG
ncbi:MAG: 2-oxoacid:acceptor oxidoreductase family protein [Clostridia bacterium]|nr:2-oxoacid:acceptor oxidoreductase family protein [Clostridia bacterium]